MHWLAALVQTLHTASSYQQLTDALLIEAQRHLGLTTVWIYRKDPRDDAYLHMVGISGTNAARLRAIIPKIPIIGDPMVEALCRGEGPFAFDDLQTVPGLNQEIIDEMGTRAIINAALANIDDSLGVIGAGTFRDEGARPMPPEAIDRWMQVVAVASTIVARIRYRTREEQRQRLAAQVAQRQRLESVGELVGGTAHDLNNLLMVIDHSLSFLGDEPLTPTQQSDVDSARAAVTSAGRLTSQLLTFARHSPLQRQPLRLRGVVRSVQKLIARSLPHSISLDVQVSQEDLWVLGDAGALEQLLLNLAINARDAMPDGGQLHLSLSARSGHAVLTVNDTGIGMSDAVRMRIFDPFFTTKGPDRGTGLGLAVAIGIVEQHHGQIRCYSEVGVGTTFRVELPLVGASATEAAPKATSAPRGGTEKILVIDDDSHIRLILRRLLARAGYTIHTARSGREALALGGGFDLCLIDAIMPGLSGQETIAALRQRDPGCRILLISGYGPAQLSDLLDDLDIPALSKPIDPHTLLRTVRRLLDAPQGGELGIPAARVRS